MPAAIATSGGTRKPFSYCPGGIDFSELKSPKMARRIAKHQSGMSAASPCPPSPLTVPSSPTPKQPVAQTNTLPNYSSGSSQSKPQLGRQRSISDLMSTSNESPTPSSLPQVGSSPIFNYNPYASDRSISIPPPTPPPVIPQQTVDPINRANSLPPGAAPAAPTRNAALHTAPKNIPGRPGLPPPHPVHQLLQTQTQHEMPSNKSATLPSPSTHENQQFSSEEPRMSPPNQGDLRQIPTQGMQHPHAMPPMQAAPPCPPMQGAPPPPPPPPPPPGSLGIVAKCGVSGVPLPGNKQVKTTISLAEIRAGNSYLEPDTTQHISNNNTNINNNINNNNNNNNNSMNNMGFGTVAPSYQQPIYTDNMINNNEGNKISAGNIIPELDNSRESGFAESLHEFEAQRNAMMSPPATSRNINNFQDPRKDSSIYPINAQENAFNQGKQTYNTLPGSFNSFSTDIDSVSNLPLSVMELNNQTLNRKNPSVSDEQINTNVKDKSMQSKSLEPSLTKYEANYSQPMGVSQPPLTGVPTNDPIHDQAATNVQPSLMSTEKSYQHPSPPRSEVKSELTSPNIAEIPSQPILNDDIKMSRPRERSIPRQQSLQRDCDGHSVTPNAYKQDIPDNKQRYNLPAQKSIDKDEPELMEINGHTGRRDSDASTQGNVRYRPETPRVVTPVRFSATPKLPNRGLQKQTSVQDKPQNVPLPPKPIEKAKPNNVYEDVKKIVRNVSDSGISVNSSTPEPEETAEKIVTESMQKIEAQMKKILGSKNIETPKKIENSESASSINSTNQGSNDSKRGSIFENGQDAQPSTYSTMSGYSTCSEEELKFEEPKVNTPIKTAPFEVMEEFEEAPEEFDLGISSYSISHPVETEEMEKTPVPEVLDNNEAAKEYYEDTPYRVSPPTRSGTLEFEKKPKDDGAHKQYSHSQQPQYHQQYQQQHPDQQYQQQYQNQQPMTPNTAPFMTPQHNMFTQMNMPGMGFPNMPDMNMPNMGLPNMMGMPPNPSLFDESFSQFPNMFDQPFPSAGMFNTGFPSMPVSSPYQPKQTKDEQQGERIIPIKVVNTNSQNLMNNYSDQTRKTEETTKKIIEVPIMIEGSGPVKQAPKPMNNSSPPQFAKPKPNISPLNFSPSPKEATPVNQNISSSYQSSPKYSPQNYPSSPKEVTPVNKYSPPTYPSSPKEATPMNKYSPPTYQSLPTPPTPPANQPQRSQEKIPESTTARHGSFSNTLPGRSSTVSPQTVKFGSSVPRNSQMSPVPTASMLQNQLSQMQNRKMEERQTPVRNQRAEEPRPAFVRSTSVAADNIRSRLAQKAPKTPTYSDLQHKYTYANKNKSPSPILDKDYQKEARQTVVGELSSYGGVQQASKITGPRKKPSQSPSMRFLSMLHVHDDPDEPVSELHASSKEYTGDQGRYMPPRAAGHQFQGPADDDGDDF